MDYLIENDYNANEDGELILKKGDIVTNAKFYRDGWMIGELGGKQGVFPSFFGQPLTDESRKSQEEITPEDSIPNINSNNKDEDNIPKPKKVIGIGFGNIFDGAPIKLRLTNNYQKVKSKTSVDEVKLPTPLDNRLDKEKDIVPNLEDPEDIKSNNNKMNEADVCIEEIRQPKKVKGVGFRNIFSDEVISKANGEDSKLDIASGKETTKENEMARVVYNYTTDNPDELNLNEGEIITLIEKENEWWKGKLLNGRIGRFRKNHVELIQTEDICDKIKLRPTPCRKPVRSLSEKPQKTPPPVPKKPNLLKSKSFHLAQTGDKNNPPVKSNFQVCPVDGISFDAPINHKPLIGPNACRVKYPGKKRPTNVSSPKNATEDDKNVLIKKPNLKVKPDITILTQKSSENTISTENDCDVFGFEMKHKDFGDKDPLTSEKENHVVITSKQKSKDILSNAENDLEEVWFDTERNLDIVIPKENFNDILKTEIEPDIFGFTMDPKDSDLGKNLVRDTENPDMIMADQKSKANLNTTENDPKIFVHKKESKKEDWFDTEGSPNLVIPKQKSNEILFHTEIDSNIFGFTNEPKDFKFGQNLVHDKQNSDVMISNQRSKDIVSNVENDSNIFGYTTESKYCAIKDDWLDTENLIKPKQKLDEIKPEIDSDIFRFSTEPRDFKFWETFVHEDENPDITTYKHESKGILNNTVNNDSNIFIHKTESKYSVLKENSSDTEEILNGVISTEKSNETIITPEVDSDIFGFTMEPKDFNFEEGNLFDTENTRDKVISERKSNESFTLYSENDSNIFGYEMEPKNSNLIRNLFDTENKSSHNKEISKESIVSSDIESDISQYKATRRHSDMVVSNKSSSVLKMESNSRKFAEMENEIGTLRTKVSRLQHENDEKEKKINILVDFIGKLKENIRNLNIDLSHWDL